MENYPFHEVQAPNVSKLSQMICLLFIQSIKHYNDSNFKERFRMRC